MMSTATRRRQLQQALYQNIERLARRRLEGLALYNPLPKAHEFHRSNVRIALLDGPNQGGKSLMGAAEFAWRITGTHPFKTQRRKKRLALVVGPETDHIGDPMWRYLSQPGAFSVINDEHTGRLRSVRADRNDPTKLDPYDKAYKEKWRDAPPLLPDRFIKDIAYESVVKQVPRNVVLINGATILFRPAGGAAKPPRGRQLTDWWFDEEVSNPAFLRETIRGSMRFGGSGFWSATPETGGFQLFELHERALASDPDVKAFTVYLEDNPFISEEDKRAFYDSLDDEQRRVKYYGEYLIAGRRVYSMFDPNIHCYEPFPIPRHWCFYLFVDPGHRSGTVFAAVDPEEKHLWVYKSVELRNCTQNRWADMVWEEHHDRPIEAMVIDERAGRQTGIAGGATVASEYYEALKVRGIEPRSYGPRQGFMPGTSDIEAREQSLVGMLTPRYYGPFEGLPKIQFAKGTNAKLVAQIQKAHKEAKNPKKRAKDRTNPEDVLQGLEYGAHYNPSYRFPQETPTPKPDPVFASYQAAEARRQRRQGRRGIEL